MATVHRFSAWKNMGHPLLDEFCRAHHLQPHFLHRCQREIREQIQPMLDERERLLEENAALKAQIDRLSRKKGQEAA